MIKRAKQQKKIKNGVNDGETPRNAYYRNIEEIA